MFIQNDTIWLQATFYDRNGDLYDPVVVTLKLYDAGRAQIGSYTSEITKTSTGIYECPVVLPEKHTVVAEWDGTDSDGYHHIIRGEIHPDWAGDIQSETADYLHAENISIADAGSKFTATNVEDALAELEARVAALE